MLKFQDFNSLTEQNKLPGVTSKLLFRFSYINAIKVF